MKNRILSLTVLAGLLFTGGCSLQEDPYGFYSSENFYKTEADAESGLMYAYNALNYLEYLRGIWYVGDIPTETMYAKSDEPGDIHMLDKWTVNADTELTHYYFKYCYIGINRANTVIQRVNNSNISDTAKKRITGEAHFLRAWNYFNLVRTFGRVPFYTEPISSLDQTNPSLAPDIAFIYKQILSDLGVAEERLEVNKVFGRVDIVAAQALLAKVYLHMASSKENNAPGYSSLTESVDDLYTEAVKYSRMVIEDYNATYFYDDNLLDIFDVYKPEGPEHIFIMAIDRSGTHEGQYSKIPLQFLPNNGGTPIYIKYSDGSLKKGNGNGWGVFLLNSEFVEGQFAATDKRRTELIHRQVYTADGLAVSPSPVRGYFSAKYVDPDFNGEWTSARPFLIRFSDIALVFAEAVGPGEGLAVVNRIRTRAGVPGLPSGMNLADFRKEVLKERALELAFEGNRLFDLRRTASVTRTVAEAARLTEAQAAFYPIPQREVDLNPNVNSSNNN